MNHDYFKANFRRVHIIDLFSDLRFVELFSFLEFISCIAKMPELKVSAL